MAYMSQEKKTKIAANVKPVLKKYGVKGSLAVSDHRTLVLNIREGNIDFIGNMNETCLKDRYQIDNGFQPVTDDYIDVNPYHYDKHFTGQAKAFLDEVVTAMNDGNWDKSDIQTDYFDIGWYVGINIGRWDKPYKLEKA